MFVDSEMCALPIIPKENKIEVVQVRMILTTAGSFQWAKKLPRLNETCEIAVV